MSKKAKFPIEMLREHVTELFGVKVEVFDAAVSQINKKEVTKAEVRKRIKAYLNKEVR
ncbi:hypothetical protein J14TS2_16070 [Bacillus sp. J14TS2]|uniref:hypothetical protein n=1 Tax=Bacillus sp. J14TS2 TaxID=2807188 RepID=UPI001B214602|nr:hypothetical protein [Bacillus sp. J14TS2]GIN71132.1 hypothetical protein J14TS2_16070 [Bacillus sp. J14TS2]